MVFPSILVKMTVIEAYEDEYLRVATSLIYQNTDVPHKP